MRWKWILEVAVMVEQEVQSGVSNPDPCITLIEVIHPLS